DVGWLSDPEELIWKSPLLAQIQAKYNALSHFLNSAGAVDFADSLDEDQRRLVAERARQLAAELKDDALGEINAEIEEHMAAKEKSISSSYSHFNRFVVSRKEDIEKGGLTQDELDGLFPGVE
ncbi:MAG: hypothetical protein JXM70_08770, partial [Pirellulales bacterium]|nr:hypothetical protein [Pirellulales bacterium]